MNEYRRNREVQSLSAAFASR